MFYAALHACEVRPTVGRVSLPSPLVSAKWLTDHLGNNDLRIELPDGRQGRISGHET